MLNAEQKAKHKSRMKAHYEANKETYKEKARLYRIAHPEKRTISQRKTNMKLKYGLEWDSYVKKYNEQEGKCDICFTFMDFNGGSASQSPHIDHNHVTGEVRGLLCTRCNMGIGYFREDKMALAKAIEYLKKWES